MSDNRITVIGLGPGRRALLTVEALDALRAATHICVHEQSTDLIGQLASAGDLRPDVAIQRLADADGDLPVASTVEEILRAARTGSLVYAVPGHPFLWATTVPLCARATQDGIAVRIVAGLIPLAEGWPTLAGAMAQGAQIVPASEAIAAALPPAAERGLQGLWMGASARLLHAGLPLVIAGAVEASSLGPIAAWLRARYPAEHPVALLYPGEQGDEMRTMPLSQLDEGGDGRAIGAIHVPPLAPLDDARAPNALGYITARLRGPGGCPWDREQTPLSLTPYMIEEAYEAVDAIERADDADMVEELGDVLLQVVLHSQLAEEEGRFSLADVAEEVNRKLVRRHPHVFGDVAVSGSSEVLRNWERIKRAEKGERRASALDGIPPALPALLLAQTVGRKAAKHGFDWPNVEGTLAKVREELDEVRDAASSEERSEEMGDLLFALTSACRHLGIDAEPALRAAVRKFEARFRRVEGYARTRHLDLAALSIDELDALWNEAKRYTAGE